MKEAEPDGQCTALHIFRCWVTATSREFKCAGDMSVNAVDAPFSHSGLLSFSFFIDRLKPE